MLEYTRDRWGNRVDLIQQRYDALPYVDRIRALLLPTLLYQALSWAVNREGATIRKDILLNLSRAAERPLRGYDLPRCVQLTGDSQELADQMLHAMNADNAREAVMAVSGLIAQVAADHRMPAQDDRSYAVLTSLLILTEAMEQPEKSQFPAMTAERMRILITRAAERAAMSGLPIL